MLCTDLNIERAKRARNAAIRIQEPMRDDIMREMSWTLGIGLSLGQGSVLGQFAAFYPTDLANCLYFVDPDDYTSITPGTTMKASGTTPPVVTLAGTKTSKGAVRIECTSTTLFRWGYDNNGTTATWVASGVTIPAGGAAYTLTGSGLSATFPTGTYASNNVYEETVQTIKLKNDAAQNFTQATVAKQPRLWKAINGKYCFKWDGVGTTLFCSTVALPALTVTGRRLWFYGVGRYDTYILDTHLFSGATVYWVGTISSTVLRMIAGANSPDINYVVGTAKRWVFNFTGSDFADSAKWGATTGTTANGGSAGADTGVYIGSRRNNAGTFSDSTTGAQGLWTAEQTGANLTNLESWMSTNYGAAVLT